MEKAKKMPIGTISHGRKKMAEGKWVPVADTKGTYPGETEKRGKATFAASTKNRLIAEEKQLKKKLSTLNENASWKESKQVDAIVGRLGAIRDELREMHYQKSIGGTKMNESKIALVLIPGELSKAAKLSSVGAKHPAGLSGVNAKTKSKIPYTGHVERMKLAQMAMVRMQAPKPEDESKYADNPTVDRKGRVKGEKKPYAGYPTGVSGMGSQAHDNFGRTTILVKPSEIGSSPPEGTTAHTPVRNVR